MKFILTACAATLVLWTAAGETMAKPGHREASKPKLDYPIVRPAQKPIRLIVTPAPRPARPVVMPAPRPAQPVVAPAPAPARPVLAPPARPIRVTRPHDTITVISKPRPATCIGSLC